MEVEVLLSKFLNRNKLFRQISIPKELLVGNEQKPTSQGVVLDNLLSSNSSNSIINNNKSSSMSMTTNKTTISSSISTNSKSKPTVGSPSMTKQMSTRTTRKFATFVVGMMKILTQNQSISTTGRSARC